MKYMEIKLTVAHIHVYIVLVHILIHLLTCHTTPALIKCPLFLITFDLIYPTFIFYLYYLFFKSWINGNEPKKEPNVSKETYEATKRVIREDRGGLGKQLKTLVSAFF